MNKLVYASALFAAASLAAPLVSAKSVPTTVQAKRTLEDIRDTAAAAETEADDLERYAENITVGWQSHSRTLDGIRDDINRMGRDLSALEAQRDSLAPWERKAIEETRPLLKEAAENTTNAIAYLKDNQERLWTNDYRGYADHIEQDTEKIAKTLRTFLKLDKDREQEQRLKQSLGADSGF